MGVYFSHGPQKIGVLFFSWLLLPLVWPLPFDLARS